MGGNGESYPGTNGASHPTELRSALKNSEQDLIARALETANGSRSKAAQELGINRTTLYKKMVRYGMLKARRRNGNGKKTH